MCCKDADHVYSEQRNMVQRFELQDIVLGRYVGSSSWTVMALNRYQQVLPAVCRVKMDKLWK